MSRDSMTVTTLNAFSRKYDLVFFEMEKKDDGYVYKFIDFENKNRQYTAEEIFERVAMG
jgi:hypothetical protein